MKFIKSIAHRALAAIFAIFYRQEKFPTADFGTTDRAEERERDRRFVARL